MDRRQPLAVNQCQELRIVDRCDQLFTWEGKVSDELQTYHGCTARIADNVDPTYHCGSGTSEERLTSDHCTYFGFDNNH